MGEVRQLLRRCRHRDGRNGGPAHERRFVLLICLPCYVRQASTAATFAYTCAMLCYAYQLGWRLRFLYCSVAPALPAAWPH